MSVGTGGSMTTLLLGSAVRSHHNRLDFMKESGGCRTALRTQLAVDPDIMQILRVFPHSSASISADN